MMHQKQQEIFNLLKNLSGQRAMITIPRMMIRFTGGYEEAAMLSQLLYWYEPGRRDGWIYKSRADWAAELEITEKQVRRARTNLEAKGLIVTAVRRVDNSPVTVYKPDLEAVVETIEKHWPKRAGDRPTGASAAAQEGQSSITQDYSQDSAILANPESRIDWNQVFAEYGDRPETAFLRGLVGKGGGE